MAKYAFNTRKLLTVTFPVLVLFLLFISLPTNHADADMGPKPSMDFEFEYESGQSLEIIDGILYECDLPDCSDAKPLEELGPQRSSCTAYACSSLAYGYSDYHRLLIRFSDGKERQSNVFQSDSFNSTFRVLVRENDLFVEKIHGGSIPFGWTLIGLFCGTILSSLMVLVMLIFLVFHPPQHWGRQS
ncbi:MAG: hypothetical protein A2Z14_03905 [Chloroflexi bacterium RBG_16_48_8]|nr:MAG: hypothetical protein A2Z14_03905 [Chloroflexi bacterium RBG_16_48_8]